MNNSMDSLAPFVPAVLQLRGDDPDRIRKSMEPAIRAATTAAETMESPRTTELIDGKKIWSDLQMISGGGITRCGLGRWKQIAPDIKAVLARAGQAGAPGCRTEPDQNDRKKYSWGRPIDGFTQEEADLILAMAARHGRSPMSIQQDWVWKAEPGEQRSGPRPPHR